MLIRRFWPFSPTSVKSPLLSQQSAQAAIAMEGQPTHVETSKSGNRQQSRMVVLYEIRKSLIIET